jgi:hypothetical protein
MGRKRGGRQTVNFQARQDYPALGVAGRAPNLTTAKMKVVKCRTEGDREDSEGALTVFDRTGYLRPSLASTEYLPPPLVAKRIAAKRIIRSIRAAAKP